MSLETFRKIIPALYKTKLAFLQGWGEPLTHPEFFNFVKLAKESGCRVGTSTNGVLLDENKIEKLVESELDLIAFSLAGLGHTNDLIRRGTSFDKIIEHCRLLEEIKIRKGIERPDVHIAYLLLRSGLDELNELPDRLKDIGINQVVISTLDFVPARELEKETLHPDNESEYNYLKKRLDETVEEAAGYSLNVHYHLAHPERREPVCTENVRKAAFIAVDGSVAPCVFMKLPIDNGTFFDRGRQIEYIPLNFGNIDNEPFDRIWDKKEYIEFRDSFDNGQPQQRCLRCPKLYMT